MVIYVKINLGGGKYMNNRILSILISVLLTFSCCVFSASADENEPEENYGLESDSEECAEILLYDENVGASAFSSVYDPRVLDCLTPVETQIGGTCWMYATTSAVEQYISTNYGSKNDLSEAHGLYTLSNKINIYNYANGYYNQTPTQWGSTRKAFQYFTNWNAPLYYRDSCDWKSSVLESCFPKQKITLNGGVDGDYYNAYPVFNVSGTRYIVKSEDNIKTAILNYGSVVSQMYFKQNYITDGIYNKAYYSSHSCNSTNHLINIVGWDDNYSKTNFKENNRPPIDGAWLVRNSNWYGDYFWLSYYDGSLFFDMNNMCVISNVQKSSVNEYMLSYDYLKLDKSDLITDTVYLSNVFDLSDFNDNFDEIKKVMFYLSVYGYDNTKQAYTNDTLGMCYYEIKILPVDNSGNIATNYNNYSCLASGQFSGEGYLTANLNYPYSINVYQKVAVVIKLVPFNNQSAIKIPFTERHPDALDETSFYGTSYNNVITWADQFPFITESTNPGCFVIRPILGKSEITPENITVYPTDIIPDDYDSDVYISSMEKLCYIHTRSGQILREDIDYVKYNNMVSFLTEYTNSLNGAPTEIVLEFCDDTTKSVFINPKSIITEVEVLGDPIVGDTLVANCIGNPVRDSYDVNYQWQYSINGVNWQNISGGNSNQYEIDENLLGRFIRVVVSPQIYGNVLQGNTSDSTSVKVVILGDVNLDGEVTMEDVTLVGQYLAEMITLSDQQMLAADANRDGHVSVRDITEIQRIISGLV